MAVLGSAHVKSPCDAGDDELYAAAQQAQQGGEGNGPAHPVHVYVAARYVHHWVCLLRPLDQTPQPQDVVSYSHSIRLCKLCNTEPMHDITCMLNRDGVSTVYTSALLPLAASTVHCHAHPSFSTVTGCMQHPPVAYGDVHALSPYLVLRKYVSMLPRTDSSLVQSGELSVVF